MVENNRFQKKKDAYRFWYSPIILLAIFCIVVIFSYNMIGLFEKERETNKNKVSELNKIDELASRQEILSKNINTLNTSQGIEASVRDKFQVVKPGEKMLVIVDEEKIEAPAELVDHSFWGYIKKFFGFEKK